MYVKQKAANFLGLNLVQLIFKVKELAQYCDCCHHDAEIIITSGNVEHISRKSNILKALNNNNNGARILNEVGIIRKSSTYKKKNKRYRTFYDFRWKRYEFK